MTLLRTDEILVEMQALEHFEPEYAHAEADRLLLEVAELAGEHEIAEAFRRVPRWYA